MNIEQEGNEIREIFEYARDRNLTQDQLDKTFFYLGEARVADAKKAIEITKSYIDNIGQTNGVLK